VQASGRLLQFYFANDAPGDGGWERLQRLFERSQAKKGGEISRFPKLAEALRP